MLQKVIKIGNSIGVTLPQAFRQEVGIKIGDKVDIKEKNGKIILSPAKKSTSGVDAKFMKIVDKFMNEHEDVLAELSKR